MQRRIIARLAAASAVAGTTAMVLAPSAFAGGNGNTTNNTNLIPAAALGYIPVGPLQPGGPGPNTKISAGCPSDLVEAVLGQAPYSAGVAIQFSDGNAHLYGDALNGPPFVGTGGGNAVGDATLSVIGGTTSATGFMHAWFGFNTNPNGNGQSVNAQTIMFKGSLSDGQSISINANPGGTTPPTSSNGNGAGWGQLNMNCS